MKIKAIRAYVYKHELFNGCANGGISERYNEMYVVCDDGNWEFDSDDLPENIVMIKERKLFGEVYRHAEPLVPVDKGCVGWMAGGAILYSSDSRFPGGKPVKIHDRQEGRELYNSMFND